MYNAYSSGRGFPRRRSGARFRTVTFIHRWFLTQEPDPLPRHREKNSHNIHAHKNNIYSASNCTKSYCGSTHPSMSGNGSLMRLAPSPMLLRLHPELAVTVAGETSKSTHASKATVDACRYFAGLVRLYRSVGERRGGG